MAQITNLLDKRAFDGVAYGAALFQPKDAGNTLHSTLWINNPAGSGKVALFRRIDVRAGAAGTILATTSQPIEAGAQTLPAFRKNLSGPAATVTVHRDRLAGLVATPWFVDTGISANDWLEATRYSPLILPAGVIMCFQLLAASGSAELSCALEWEELAA